MATAGITKIFLCTLFLYCCCTVTQGETAVDCCLKVKDNPIPRHILTGYQAQVKGHGCNINAIVFTTKRGRRLCTPVESVWVKELITILDSHLKKCQAKHFKGKGCKGLKVKSN